jgi:2-hydroxychromene-2-carboxylate isomerase
MGLRKSLDRYFDFVSPFTYLQSVRLARLADRLDLRPLLAAAARKGR